MNRAGIRFFAVFASVLSLVNCSQAEDALSHKDLDKRLDRGLYEVTAAAVKIFNSGNEEGCARMFEGGLLMALPLLDDRPELKKRVGDRLAKARAAQSATDRAFMLREAVDDIRSTIKKHPSLGVMPPPKPKTLWDRLGGEAGVRILVNDMMRVIQNDPKVNATRGGKFKPTKAETERQAQKLVEFLSDHTGGPLKYTGKSMKEAHAGMGITDAEYSAMMADIVKVLNGSNVAPADVDEIARMVEGLRKDIVAPKSVAPAVKSLWDRLGGEPAVKKVVHDFVATAAKDPKVNFSRGGKYKLDDKAVARLEKQLVDFISSATGGPLKYTGKSMKAAHTGMGITEAEFNAAATDLKEALKKHNVPQKETDELMAIVSGAKKDIAEKK